MDQTASPPSRSLARVGLGVAVAAAATAVVGFASGPASVSTTGVVTVVAAVALVLHGVDVRHRQLDGARLMRSVAGRVVVTGLLVIPFLAPPPGALPPQQLQQRLAQSRSIAENSGHGTPVATTPDRAFAVLLVLALLAVVLWSGLLGAVLGRLRIALSSRTDQVRVGAAGLPASAANGDEERAVRDALQVSARRLGAAGNERQAVIDAYVTLEAHLGEAGFPRAPSETAREFVSRTLLQRCPALQHQVEALLDIFGRARFSAQPITPDQAHEAGRHLSALREA